MSDRTTRAHTEHHRWSFAVARVAGIEIRVHASFFLLVALVVVAGSDREGPGVPWALAWLVLIFTCVVVHELAHCFVGRAYGAVVEDIVLLPIGGISKLEHLPESPSHELAMAIAGPGASVALALLSGGSALLAGDSLLPVDLFGGSLLTALFWFNLIVAAFNLLPAFPLDGGRVFRALLERRMSLERATRTAASIGRAAAVLLTVVGVFVDVWLVIIGVFLFFGASAEEAATIVHVRLRGHRVSDVMVDARSMPHDELRAMLAELTEQGVPTVVPSDDLEEVLPSVLESRRGAVVVTDHERIVGVVRVEDVQHLVDRAGVEQNPRKLPPT